VSPGPLRSQVVTVAEGPMRPEAGLAASWASHADEPGDREGPYELTLDQAEAKVMSVSTFYRAELGDRVDAERGSIITVKPGALLDIAMTGQHYIAEGNGSLREISAAQLAEEGAELAAAFTPSQ
jgi:hypothetical protein